MTVRFLAPDGLEVPAVTAAQMREVDRIAVEETGPNLFQMMENAGRSLALEAISRLGRDWRTSPIVVLAGTGGNGGGGICAARHLANRGADIILCIAESDRLSDIAAFQRKVYAAAGGQEIAPSRLKNLGAALVIDALLGYSLKGAPRPPVAALIRWADASGIPILSLDVPSGVDATTGETPGEHVRATWTLTLALPKTGLRPEHSGEVILADLGIPSGVFQRIGIPYRSPFGAQFHVPLRMVV